MAKISTPATDSPYASTETPYSFFRGLRHMLLDKKRREKPDPVPVAPPLGYKKTPSLSEQIRDMVRSEKLAADLAAKGVETFEEADDFNIPDDPIDPSSPYEADFEGDAAGALREAARPPERAYASVEEFLTANPHIKIGSEQLRPEPPPSQPKGGGGEDLAIAPGETPTYGETPVEPRKMGFFARRG